MPAGWAAAPGPVHIDENECPGPTEARFVVWSPGLCRPAAKRDQTHHNPGSPRPPGPAPSISRAMRRFLLPHARVQTQKPRLPRVSCSRARWTSVGGNEKLRIPDAKPSGSYSAYGWVERSPRRIPRPWPAPPSGGLRGGGNSFQRFSSSVQPKSL